MTKPSPDIPSPAEGFQAAIKALEQHTSELWRRERSVSHELAHRIHPGMEPAAYGILALLSQKGPLRMTAIAVSIGIGKPSVSRQITALVKLELIERRPDSTDRRAHFITLTPAGKRKILGVQKARRQAFRALMADWNSPDIRELSTLLSKLNETYTNDPW
ncbi:MarR family transcriptional regulator [Arthrobacter sp. Soc17.1.1.1]|uniref:MarR family winged helix-turn-helix transcriptional regulator n=1 Tax=Arthrobacter sp. Soc17.1.1.1 TaxID=3121277 RepID=UPI002FE4638B